MLLALSFLTEVIVWYGKKAYQPCFKSPIYKVFPRGARTFKTVLKLGVVLPFSILAITGCFTPLSSSSSRWEIPLSFLALVSSPIRATRKSLSAISYGVKTSLRTSSQVVHLKPFSSTLIIDRSFL